MSSLLFSLANLYLRCMHDDGPLSVCHCLLSPVPLANIARGEWKKEDLTLCLLSISPSPLQWQLRLRNPGSLCCYQEGEALGSAQYTHGQLQATYVYPAAYTAQAAHQKQSLQWCRFHAKYCQCHKLSSWRVEMLWIPEGWLTWSAFAITQLENECDLVTS